MIVTLNIHILVTHKKDTWRNGHTCVFDNSAYNECMYVSILRIPHIIGTFLNILPTLRISCFFPYFMVIYLCPRHVLIVHRKGTEGGHKPPAPTGITGMPHHRNYEITACHGWPNSWCGNILFSIIIIMTLIQIKGLSSLFHLATKISS